MPRLAIAMHEATMLYEVAIAAEIFGVDRSDLSAAGEWYDLVVCTADGAPHMWLPTAPTAGFEALAGVDTVIVPSTDTPEGPASAELIEALRAAHDRGTRIASLCTGAFVLAEAGLLDGRTATTHWMHADDLARRYPLIDVRADILYSDDDRVLTSAGKTAALDLCLHLVRKDLGAAAANGLARRLVVPAHRPGGQSQFVARPEVRDEPDGLGVALEWARTRLDRAIAVEDLARQAGLSSRQLARRMQAGLQIGPSAWLQQQRVARAQELLERTDASVDQIAAACGMGTATTLRRHFRRLVGVSPTSYRATFRP
jgi:AraC family transcriptional regulator, transcriptional activator FtrA